MLPLPGIDCHDAGWRLIIWYRYLFGAVGTAVCLPAVESIGVGWFSTISAGFLVASSLAGACAVKWGQSWRDAVDQKRRAKRGKMLEEERVEKIVMELQNGKEKDMV